jgi:hypothetical protein
VSGARTAEDRFLAEPSWKTALSEADTASRHLRQATASLERLSRELRALREWGETNAQLELAHALTDGPDGGALDALLAASSDPEGDPALRATARMLLDRLTSALGLEPVGERGELLRLFPDDLAAFEVRGGPSTPTEADRGLYCVVRPGWCLGPFIVVRPLLEELVAEAGADRVPGAGPSGPRTTRETAPSDPRPWPEP